MSVSLLLISHGSIGQSILDAATAVLNTCPLHAHVISIPMDCQRDILLNKANEQISFLDQGDGVLVLTDLYGATPCNLACDLKSNHIAVVAGLNLPMLIRVMNYPHLTLEEMTEKAVSGGRDGVLPCLYGIKQQ